jgi:hypothetical protein
MDFVKKKKLFFSSNFHIIYYTNIYIANTLSVHTFVTVISASTGRNDFIFDIWLWHGDLYRISPFQVYRTSTCCLPCDLQMNEWGYSYHDIACNILFKFIWNLPEYFHVHFLLISYMRNWDPSWSYGSWFYNYFCNQCLSPLKLWVRTSFMERCTLYKIMW